MPILADIRVRISCIKVDDKYYSFRYEVKLNGKLKKKDRYDSDHVWADDKPGFKKFLEDGGAVEIALQSTF